MYQKFYSTLTMSLFKHLQSFIDIQQLWNTTLLSRKWKSVKELLSFHTGAVNFPHFVSNVLCYLACTPEFTLLQLLTAASFSLISDIFLGMVSTSVCRKKWTDEDWASSWFFCRLLVQLQVSPMEALFLHWPNRASRAPMFPEVGINIILFKIEICVSCKHKINICNYTSSSFFHTELPLNLLF